MDKSLIFSLLAVIVVQQLFFIATVHRLVNKVMSRSFYDYEQAKFLSKKDKNQSGLVPMEIKTVGEDLDALQDF